MDSAYNPPTLRIQPLAFSGLAICAIFLAGCAAPTSPGNTAPAALRQALTFHVSFDHSADADFACGDAHVYTAPAMNKRGEAVAGLPGTAETVLVANEGRFGGALKFTQKKAPVVFYHAAQNFPYQSNDWNGTVSFWLSVDPATQLDPGFCDPIQITPKAWNDAAFFVEFEKMTNAIPFRLGVYSDYRVWNPTDRKWADIPMSDKPLITVNDPPFGQSKWTHVAFTFADFNRTNEHGTAKLYLDGEFRGEIAGRPFIFSWDPAQSAIMLGLSYMGLFDELSVFQRALTAEEVRALYELRGGITRLLTRQ